MITSDEQQRDDRTVRIALIASVLVHLLLALFYIGTTGLLTKLHILLPHPKPNPDEAVAISSSLTLDKRTKPVPAPPPAHTQAKPVQPRQPAPESVPVPQQVVQRPAAAAPVPSKQRHELSKVTKSAPPEPPKTVKAEQTSQTPTAPPERTTPSPIKAPRRVAQAEAPDAARQQRRPQEATNPSHLSDQQLAQINSDLSQTIARARSAENPLQVSHPQPPSAMKHYQMSMLGVPGDMRGAQGLCGPIKGWGGSDGMDYYYVTCNVQLPDGTMKTEPVPWPVHFPSHADPFNGTLQRETALQLPPPGWSVPAGITVPKEILDYARSHGAQI